MHCLRTLSSWSTYSTTTCSRAHVETLQGAGELLWKVYVIWHAGHVGMAAAQQMVAYDALGIVYECEQSGQRAGCTKDQDLLLCELSSMHAQLDRHEGQPGRNEDHT